MDYQLYISKLLNVLTMVLVAVASGTSTLDNKCPRKINPYDISRHDDVQLQLQVHTEDMDGLNCTRMMKYVTKAPKI